MAYVNFGLIKISIYISPFSRAEVTCVARAASAEQPYYLAQPQGDGPKTTRRELIKRES